MARKTLEQVLAKNCREYRRLQKLSQQRVADLSGLHLRHYQKIEAAEVNVTLRTLQTLAGTFKTLPHFLLW